MVSGKSFFLFIQKLYETRHMAVSWPRTIIKLTGHSLKNV